MSAVTRKNNIRVVVEARRLGDWGFASMSGVGTPESREKHLLTECERIVREVNRHVEGISTAAVVCDLVTVCEFCENDWADSCINETDSTAEYPVGLPVCCVLAQDEWNANHDTAATS
jgi:hypothetical protein